MYAIFKDPTPGQENVAGNCIWGPCSEPPFCGYLRRDHWPPGLVDLTERGLPDDWMPTPAATAKAERVTVAFAAYDVQRKKLERQLADALNFFQDTDYANLIRADITALDDEYMIQIGVIMDE